MLRMFVVMLVLGACASPSREFRDASKKSIFVDGDEITVFSTDNRAQAIRTNFRGKKQQVGANGRFRYAIETLTGCQLANDTFTGDISIVSADINC